MTGERKWRLGEDLATCDNLLDPITFDDLLLAVHCNVKKEHINEDAVRRELMNIFQGRVEDMMFLVNKNMDLMVRRSVNYYRDE